MTLSRRNLLLASAALPLQAMVPAAATPPSSAAASASAPGETIALPARKLFGPMRLTYLDSGSWHPPSIAARQSAEHYLATKSLDQDAGSFPAGASRQAVLDKFARLINADAKEVCYVNSTTAGENLIIQALDLPARGGRVVTDTLHFFGSFYLYQELAKRGVEVITLRHDKNGRIDPKQYEAAIDGNTRLVALSLVSTFNGFEHDLQRICQIAHAKGAPVYADIIHAVGSVPVDVRESGVDFAACASYKWLMGDMGLGFLYVRADRLPTLKRPWYGYHQIQKFDSHIYPFDPPGDTVADSIPGDDTAGYFEMGTTASAAVALLGPSLDLLLAADVKRIANWRQPLLRRIQSTLRKRGLQPLTPENSRTPLVAFALEGARDRLQPKLKAAKVDFTVSKNRFRLSVAMFNDSDDIERALEVLA